MTGELKIVDIAGNKGGAIAELVGQVVEAVESWPGCPCVIKMTGGYVLKVECLWRLRDQGALIRTSQDDGQQFGLSQPVDAVAWLATRLVSRAVTHVSVAAGTADLDVACGDVTLEVLSDSSGYEAWQIEGPGGLLVVAQGGGIVVWDHT